jgi:hypothetical protein
MKTTTYLFEENKKQSSGLGHRVDVAHRSAQVAKTSIGSGKPGAGRTWRIGGP